MVMNVNSSDQCKKTRVMTVDCAVEESGFGASQMINIGASSFIFFLELLSLVSDGILLPIIKCQWNLSSSQATAYLLSTRIAFGIGGLIGGKISDKIGRRLSILIGLVFQITTTTISVYSFSLVWYILFHALNKVSFGIVMPSAHSYAVESCPASKRFIVKIVFGYGGCFGTLVGAFVGQFYEVYSWRFIQLLLTFPSYFVFIVFYFCMEPSPRFLMVQGKIRRAENVVNNMFRRNGRVIDWEICLESKAEINEEPGTYMDLLSPNLALHTYTLMFLMFMKGIFITTVHISMPYIMKSALFDNESAEKGIGFPHSCYSGTAKIYSKMIMSILPDFFIHPAVLFYAQKQGRCHAIRQSFFLSSICFIASYFLSTRVSSLFSISIGMSLSTITAVRSVMALYATELYPTTTRGVAGGMLWSADNLGSLAAPFLVEYVVVDDPLSFLVLSGLAMGVTGLVSSKLQSETLNKPLAQSLTDLNRPDLKVSV